MTTTTDFRWFPGIPSRNLFTQAKLAGTSVRVTFLTLLGFVLIEELGSDAMPLRTLSQIDVYGKGYGLPDVERLIRDLGVTP